MSRSKPRGPRDSVGRSEKSARSDRIVYGIGPVTELITRQPGAAIRLVVRAGAGGRLAKLADDARAIGLVVADGDAAELEAAAGVGANHQGVVCFAGPYRYAALETILDAAAPGRPIVVLDSVTDPHNLGAVCRSAYLLGAAGLIIGRDRAAPVNAVATKASAGATECLAIAQVTNLARALAEIREADIWRARIASGTDAQPLTTIDRSLAWALVLGSEGRGVRQLVARETDFAFEIPMRGESVGSFNVSVAAAIALYELARGAPQIE